MARLAHGQRDFPAAIIWGERAIAIQLDPATLNAVGDAYAALGDTAKAREYFHTLEVSVSAQAGPSHRAWSLYLLDHGLHVDEVLARATDALRTRKDIYGYDLVAWALYKAGRPAEAATFMRDTMRLGTPDPLLQRHARAIEQTLSLRIPTL